MIRNRSALPIFVCSAALAAASNNLTGVWILDVPNSSWGKMNVPSSVIVEIQHTGDRIHYTGTVAYANEDTRDFAFDGAIDGKEYSVVRSFGSGVLSLRRTDEWTLQTAYRSDNGAYQETSRTVLSMDGTRLTRYMSLKSPLGPRSWIEVYRRRK